MRAHVRRDLKEQTGRFGCISGARAPPHRPTPGAGGWLLREEHPRPRVGAVGSTGRPVRLRDFIPEACKAFGEVCAGGDDERETGHRWEELGRGPGKPECDFACVLGFSFVKHLRRAASPRYGINADSCEHREAPGQV